MRPKALDSLLCPKELCESTKPLHKMHTTLIYYLSYVYICLAVQDMSSLRVILILSYIYNSLLKLSHIFMQILFNCLNFFLQVRSSLLLILTML